MRILPGRRPILIGWSLVVLVVIFAGCASGPAAQQATPTPSAAATLAPTSAPSPTASPGVKLTPPTLRGPLAAAPTNCPASPAIQTMTQNNFGGGFSSPISFQGGQPAWELGLPDAGRPLQLGATGGDQPWPSIKVMWVVGPDAAQPVTLTGHDLRTGTPLWFQIYPSNAIPTSDPNADSVYTTSATLDPMAPNRGSTDNSTGHWNIWGIGIIALAAGCYELDVSSAGGGWHVIYPIGR